MKRNPHNCDAPASGVAVTAVGADDKESSTLPPAPGQPPSDAWDVPTPPSLEVPASRGSLADGLNGFDEVMPHAVELEGERRTPRQVPAARPAPRPVTSTPPAPRRYLLEAASVMAVTLVLVVMVHVLMLPAPAVRPGVPVPIGAATIECLAADPEVSATSSAAPIPIWSCTWGRAPSVRRAERLPDLHLGARPVLERLEVSLGRRCGPGRGGSLADRRASGAGGGETGAATMTCGGGEKREEWKGMSQIYRQANKWRFIEINFFAGTDIGHAAREAVDLASKRRQPVRFKFNGQRLVARRRTAPAAIVQLYHDGRRRP